jgi:uncharacterized membrane protein (UPF0127 family)
MKIDRALMLLLVMVTTACEHRNTPPPAPVATAQPQFVVTLPDSFRVAVEIVANDELRAQGLMYRESVPSGTGMLFVYRQSGEYGFWMKNTYIPLDMIWMDETGQVVALHENVPPCRADPCPGYNPGTTARYILELAAGEAKAHGVKVGAKVQLPDLSRVEIR